MTLVLALAISLPQADAQRDLRNFELEELTVDTLTDDGTVNFLYPAYADDNYDLTWQVKATNISGTTAGTANLQYTLDKGGTGPWFTAHTWTFSAAGDTTFVIRDFPGARARMQVVGTGTQSSTVDNWVRWLKVKN